MSERECVKCSYIGCGFGSLHADDEDCPKCGDISKYPKYITIKPKEEEII